MVVDMNCFRRWGHNEMDDPTFTNPKIYSLINSRRYFFGFYWVSRCCYCFNRSVPDIYAEKLIKQTLVNEQECLDIEGEQNEWLNEELKLSETWKPQVSFGTVQISYRGIIKLFVFTLHGASKAFLTMT